MVTMARKTIATWGYSILKKTAGRNQWSLVERLLKEEMDTQQPLSEIAFTSLVVGLVKDRLLQMICIFSIFNNSNGSTTNSQVSHLVLATCIQLTATKTKFTCSEEEMDEIIWTICTSSIHRLSTGETFKTSVEWDLHQEQITAQA